MQQRIIISAMLVMALSATAFAEKLKEKVLIFNISITYEKSILIDERRKTDEDRFDYYAFIIPHTIAQNLNASGRIEAKKIDGELRLKDIGSDAFYAEMQKIGAVHGAQYLIGGRGTVRGKKLTLELALVNIRTRDFTAITKDSFETGAELKTTINDLSSNIEQKLGVYLKESREQHEVSPFLKAYRALDGLSFGVKTGRFFIKGPFSKVYEDSEYISPYLSYGILKWFGLTAEADYLTADNGNIIIKQRSSILVWGLSLNADFSYRFFEHFGVRLSAGFGASTGKIYLSSSDNPFIGITSVKKSTDPYLNIAASFNLLFKPVELHVGGGYKSAFFKGKSLSLVTVFFGIGFHL